MKNITPSIMIVHFVSTLLFSTLLSGCMKPAYPNESEVRERFQTDYRDTTCKLVKIYPAKAHPDQKSLPFLYAYIRFEAQCTDLNGSNVSIIRQQVWQLHRERPSLFQGAWRWTQAGEIADY
jgi:hypothetical protein